MTSFATRVHSRRKSLGLSQAAIASLCGLNQSDVSKIEQGKILETPRILDLANALQCSPYWLKTGIGEVTLDASPTAHEQSEVDLKLNASPFGERLRMAREFKGRTQTQAAIATGLKQPTICAAEKDGMGSKHLLHYASAYGVDPRWLATGEGSMVSSATSGSEPSLLAPTIGNSFGSRLKQARKFAGLSQTQLAKATGIPQSTISTAEIHASGSSDTATYAKVCGVSANWLATGEGEMLPNAEKSHAVSAIALEIARLFDMIPEADRIRRTKAYNAATAAILEVIQNGA